jgi:pimeloyl-ACP methyl ester carboxylesterase
MSSTRALSGRRWRRAAVALGCAVLGVGLHLGGRGAVARAVVLAPNAGSAGIPRFMRLPEPLAARGAFALTTVVGPPSARLVSWVAPEQGRPVRGTIALMHGVRMDKRSLVSLGVALVDAGFRVVLVDLRGHGESTGEYLTYGAREAEDVATVLRRLGEAEPLGPLGAYGFSYGGAVALALAEADPRVKAVVTVATFSSLRSVVGDYRRKYLPGPLRLIPDAWFQGAVDEAAGLADFDPDLASPVRAVQRSSERLLLLHGEADTQVLPRHSALLGAAAGPRASVVTLPGGTHDNLSFAPEGEVARRSVAWFEQWLAQPPGADTGVGE